MSENVPSDVCAQTTQISLHIRAVFFAHMKKLCDLGYPKCAQWRFRSDCTCTQSDLNLRCAHVRRYISDDAAQLFPWKSYLTLGSSAPLIPVNNSVNSGSTRVCMTISFPSAAAAFRRTGLFGSFNALTNVVCSWGKNGFNNTPT